MNKLLTLLVLSTFILAACQTRYISGLSAQEKKQAVQISILDTQTPGPDYMLLQMNLRGESCRITVDDDTVISKDDAMLELKYAAFKVGADTLANVQCKKESRGSKGSSCLEAFFCRGDGYVKNK